MTLLPLHLNRLSLRPSGINAGAARGRHHPIPISLPCNCNCNCNLLLVADPCKPARDLDRAATCELWIGPMGPSSAVSKDAGGGGAGEEDHRRLRAMAARTATDSLRAAVARSGAAEKVARLEECARSLEAEKAKMEVFRRELPISVHLIADVIEWLKDEVAQHRRPAPDQLLAPSPSPSPAPPARRKAEGVKTEADATDKRSWMSSAQLWTCGSHSSASTSNGGGDRRQAQKVSNAFMPLTGLPTSAKSSDRPEAAAMVVPELSLSSPVIDAPCLGVPSANSSVVTDAGEQQRQQSRKARRCWSPELHRRFVAALQRLGGPHVATPKQIRDMMKVDGLTNDEVKSHLQKYRLHTRRTSDGDRQQQSAGVWPPPEQYTTSQHSTSQSGSPQGPLQLTTGSSRALSVTAGDSCEGGQEEEEDGRSASYSWEMQRQNGTKASSSS